jgi:hypothetical protein
MRAGGERMLDGERVCQQNLADLVERVDGGR